MSYTEVDIRNIALCRRGIDETFVVLATEQGDEARTPCGSLATT